MGQSSDYSQVTVLLLCIVIVLLYYLYRAKKRKLQQEEQKYIQKFLLSENIQRYSSSSPLKGSGFSPTRFRRVGEFNSPKQNRVSGKPQTKQSPAKKSQTVILDRSSPPSIDKKSLSPASRISGLKADMLQDTKFSPDRRMNKATSASNLLRSFGTTNANFQKSVEIKGSQGTRVADRDQSPKDIAMGHKTNKVLKEFENITPVDSSFADQPESSTLRILPVPEKVIVNASVDSQKNVQTNEVNGKVKNASAPVKKREISFLEDDSPQIPQKKVVINENKQFETITDSSFESDQETEEAAQADISPINRRQILEKSKIDIAELGKYGSSTSLKRYVAKKAVQERMRERPNPKSMDQFFRSAQAASKVSAVTTKPTGTGLATQTSQTAAQAGASKPTTQGGLFPSNPTPKPADNTAVKPAGQGALFPSANKQTPAPSQTQGQAEAPKSTGLFAGAGGTAGGTSSGTQTSGQAKPGLFSAGANKEPAQPNNNQANAPKEQEKPAQTAAPASGGGLFGNLNAQKTAESGSGGAAKPQDKPQIQTGGLFGNKSAAPTATPGKLFGGQNSAASSSKTSTPLFAAKDSAQARGGDIEDFNEGPLKKVLTK